MSRGFRCGIHLSVAIDRLAAIDDLQHLKQLHRSAVHVSRLAAFDQALDAVAQTFMKFVSKIQNTAADLLRCFAFYVGKMRQHTF